MSSAIPPVQVAISTDLLLAFSRIPKQQQGKVRAFIEKFQANPTAAGINYETIQNARDANLRSVRIDQTYRGIVLKPKQGNVYALLWVDHHDDAYAWACRRQVAVHPTTGALQVLVVEESAGPAVPPAQVPATPAGPTHLFAGYDDDALLALGVPQSSLPLVRGLESTSALDAVQRELPAEAYEGLFLLASGFKFDEILAERSEEAPPPPAVDPEDFAAALARPDTRRRFVVVTDDDALAKMLDAPLAQWRVFLHPSQLRLVEQDAKGPVRVLGGAGTGKTVVAMHRARYLATKLFPKATDRILVTTFTRNLARDLQDQLKALCTPEALARIEVANLDAWVGTFLAAHGVKLKLAYREDLWRTHWESAIATVPDTWTPNFLREEFERVIMDQGLTSEAEYMTAPRVGRGTLLGRRDRKTLWAAFEDYRARLRERGLIEPTDAMREARQLLEAKGPILPYKAVVVDEAQDLGPQAFLLLRAIVPKAPNDMFIVGDAHQRIYGRKVVLGRCGIEVRGRRSSRLRINYRTTDEIRRWAVDLMAGKPIDDLDGEADTVKGYKSLLHGAPPDVAHFKTFETEVEHLAALIREWEGAGAAPSDTCLVARTTRLRDRYAEALISRGIATYVVADDGDDPSAPGVRVATMHRVKGLEFERVLVAGANEGVLPLAVAVNTAADPTSEAERELGERSLLYVAATRAKRYAVVTSHGKPSSFLRLSIPTATGG